MIYLLIILYLRVFFHDNSTNKVWRYSRYQVSKLTWNNDVFCKWYQSLMMIGQSNSQNLRDHESHRPQIHWLTWNKQMPLSPFREKARKWGTKCYLKTKAEEKSKAEVSFGEYWPRNHLPRVAISSCPFGICFKYNFVFWLLWNKYVTCMLILLWRLYIPLEIRSKRIM